MVTGAGWSALLCFAAAARVPARLLRRAHRSAPLRPAVCLMLAADRAHVVAATFEGALRASAAVTLLGQIVTIMCNFVLVRQTGPGAWKTIPARWTQRAPPPGAPDQPGTQAPAPAFAPSNPLPAHPSHAPPPALPPAPPQLLYFGGEIQDLRRASPGDMKAGTMLPLSSDMQPGSAGGADGVQMAAVSYGSGPYGAGAGTNPFAGSV